MLYKVLPADTIYIDKFHIDTKYLLAQSDDNRIIVLSSEYKEGDTFSSDDVSLAYTITDEVYGDMSIYRNIHLPYLHNLKPFFDFMALQLKENEDYKIAEGICFYTETFIEILHTWMQDPEKPITISRINRKTGEYTPIQTFDSIEYELFNQTLAKIITENKYDFIVDYDNWGQNEIKSFVKYAIIEALVGEFFPSIRSEIYRFHSDCINSVIEDLNSSEDYPKKELQELFDKLVPSSGPSNTKAGEFVRGIGRIEYRMYNDCDNPIDYGASKASFWSLVNCFDIIISSKENYALYQSIIPETQKSRRRGYTKIYLQNEWDSWQFINMARFAIKYAETEEGKSPNLVEKYIDGTYKKVKLDIISPSHERLSSYDNYVPDLEVAY